MLDLVATSLCHIVDLESFLGKKKLRKANTKSITGERKGVKFNHSRHIVFNTSLKFALTRSTDSNGLTFSKDR